MGCGLSEAGADEMAESASEAVDSCRIAVVMIVVLGSTLGSLNLTLAEAGCDSSSL